MRAKVILKAVNGYSGRNKVNRIFRLILENGKCVFYFSLI